MDQRLMLVVNCQFLKNDPVYSKLISQKGLLPIGNNIGFLNNNANITLKYRNAAEDLIINDNTTIQPRKDIYCLKTEENIFRDAINLLDASNYIFLVCEGSPENARVVLCFDFESEDTFSQIRNENQALRFEMYNLPPMKITIVDTAHIESSFYSFLSKKDQELFSVRAQKFLKNPHILTYLFSHVMSINSKDHLNYISQLRVISDHLREFLKPKIKKISKNHNELWATFYGNKISFIDGGMSRIVSLPGTEPMGIRVGIYTVIPGETDMEKREDWNLFSYVIGDILSDKELIDAPDYQTDTKRLQEAARYLLEPLTALNYLNYVEERPKILLLHGPLQNAFETYDEREPNFIPGINQDFLHENNISILNVESEVDYLPKNIDGKAIWNGCIAVYALIMKRVSESDTPIVGVVERARSRSLTNAVLNIIVEEKIISDSAKRRLWNTIKKYEINDEFLFGCILDEGEYLQPIEIKKNIKRRAHDRWQPIIDQLPPVYSTMLKSSANNFPFRVEINKLYPESTVEEIMSLMYHTSLLLPNYAFPVGIDIADKYVKIPDWLSKGISACLTANILSKVLQTGNDRLLRQVRQLLARSPRDFYFRPKA